jgi:hypothetical protein
MAQGNSGMSCSYSQAEIGNPVGELASLRDFNPTLLTGYQRYLCLSLQWCGD